MDLLECGDACLLPSEEDCVCGVPIEVSSSPEADSRFDADGVESLIL